MSAYQNAYLGAVLVWIFLALGSFLNVLIHRIPLGENIVVPASHCPQCKARLRPTELVPVLSYALQRGRCRHCGHPVPWRYPAVEIITAVLLSLVWRDWAGAPQLMPYLILTAVLIVVAFIDLATLLIPDKLLLSGTVLWMLTQTLQPFITYTEAILGALLGFGAMFAVYLLARGGMGFGDVKLAAFLGLYLGPRLTLLTLLLSFVVGACVGVLLLALKIKGRKDAIPFGPFLALGAYLALMWGSSLMAWYLSKW